MGNLGEVRMLLTMDHCGGIAIAVSCNRALGDFETPLTGGLTVQAGGFHTLCVPGLYLCSSSVCGMNSMNSLSARQGHSCRRQLWHYGLRRDFAAVV